MKAFFTILAIVFTFSTQIFAQSQKQLVKSFSAEQVNTIIASLGGQVEVIEWKESSIRVNTTIDVANFDEDILKRLIAVGRYSLEAQSQNGQMSLTMPNTAKIVVIKGVQLEERIKFQIYVPQGVKVQLTEQPAAQQSL
jgi:hypothetical protein